MTPEELQQIQAIIQAAVAPLAQGQQELTQKVTAIETQLGSLEQGQKQINTRLNSLEQGQKKLETKISTVETRVEQSEQKILTKLDQLEKLAADYLDGRVQTVTRRVDRIEKH